ncbi:MAG TPA: hypothetical protein VMB81_23850 [Candidatus Sulfotelmatobacter sp.]|nr:hypothetical protein [Candidatus Sulfotelmatobacter sp.]
MRCARAIVGGVLLAAISIGDAAADDYGQCLDRARDRLARGQVNPAIGPDRALNAYMADFHECQRLDADAHARDQRLEQQRIDQQRADQQRLDQQRLNQQLDQQQADQQRWNQQLDQQRWNQQRLDQQRLDQQRQDQQRWNQQR